MKKFTRKRSFWVSIFFIGTMAYAYGQSDVNLNKANQTFDYEKEKAEILAVIENESKAFWDKDFERYASCWLHESFIRTMGWWEEGGITVVKGWEERGPRTKKMMEEYPDPNPQEVVRENINLRIAENMAWVTFDQYGKDTGDKRFDMPGLSRETRILEKHDGAWKFVYVGWLLEGTSKEDQ